MPFDFSEGDLASEEARRDIAKMLGQILQSRQEFSAWERVNLGMAIALLPTRWLKLCLAHVRLVLTPPNKLPLDSIHSNRYERLTRADLIEWLRRLGYDAEH